MRKRRAINLGLFLTIIWLLLSGHYTPLLLLCGLLSVVLVLVLVSRMSAIDYEVLASSMNIRALFIYCFWLLKEIFVANIRVCRLILHPAMPISPTVIALYNSQSSDFVRVIFANSITLTPGTFTIDIDRNIIEVHALTKEAANALLQGQMDAKVTMLENNPKGRA